MWKIFIFYWQLQKKNEKKDKKLQPVLLLAIKILINIQQKKKKRTKNKQNEEKKNINKFRKTHKNVIEYGGRFQNRYLTHTFYCISVKQSRIANSMFAMFLEKKNWKPSKNRIKKKC